MKKVLIFRILNIFAFFVSASSSVMRKYQSYVSNPVPRTHCEFYYEINFYRQHFPHVCFKLLEQHQSNWTFKVIFLRALLTPVFIHPQDVTQAYYSLSLSWIFMEMIKVLIFCRFEELNFKSRLETLALLLKIAKTTYMDMKVMWRIDTVLHEDLDNRIAVWTFVLENVSLDFTNKSVNYYALSVAFHEARKIIILGDSSDNATKLSKISTLLWFYLYQIYRNECKLIFDESIQNRAIYLYLILNLWHIRYDYSKCEEYHSKRIKKDLEELYNGGSLQLEPMKLLLQSFNPNEYKKGLRMPKKDFTFIELSRFLDYATNLSPYQLWKIKALAQIEAFISQHSTKIKQIP